MEKWVKTSRTALAPCHKCKGYRMPYMERTFTQMITENMATEYLCLFCWEAMIPEGEIVENSALEKE